MGALEWETRSAYALTEFVIFALGGIIFTAMLCSLGLLFCYFRNNDKYLRFVKALHRFLIKTVFTGGAELVEILYPTVKKEPKPLKARTTWGKVALYVYFTVLSGLVALWYLAVFSDSFFYRKTGTCNDLNVNDTDYSCFLISDRNIPPQVQEIIDEEPGDLVPCQRVQDFLLTSPNVTYDLEVICYTTQLSLLSAMGIAYGASRTITFLLQVVFKGCLFLAARGRIVRRILSIFQVSFVAFAVVFVFIVPTTLHEVSGPRNSPLDILRGDRFYPYAFVILLGLSTIFVAGLTPWWAFQPLDVLCCGREKSEEPSSGSETESEGGTIQERYRKVDDDDGEKEEEIKPVVE